ncbi:MAG TPA: hypothetical protein VHK05_02995 [Candidatus Limnocylindrales bacterium]|nr:hypothetical protein [Candidatus Limnocylindrales bacterium]
MAPENYASLNDQFYASRPYEYFITRMGNLLLVAARNEELDDLFDAGVSFGELSMGGGSSARTPEERDESAASARRFVTAESEVLAHHAGETLLRSYLAHESQPPCPWLEISRTRVPREFKSLVEARFGDAGDPADPEHLAGIARVFHGTDDPSTFKPKPPRKSDGRQASPRSKVGSGTSQRSS